MRKTKKIGGSNVLVTVLLFLGCLTILFPLYMTIIIAFKNPSEMTNDVAGALAFPSSWKLDNFKEAMEVTNFWHTLGNSLLITIATIVLALLIHSLAGYVIGRNMARKKGYRFIYFYIVSGMFVPFAILMMPLVKETAILGLDNRLGVILLYLVFYMPINVMLYSGYLKNIPLAMEEAAESLSDAAQSPTLTIFCFSHFFASIDGETAERLAEQIIKIMAARKEDNHMFVIMQPQEDNRLMAFRAFRKVMNEV